MPHSLTRSLPKINGFSLHRPRLGPTFLFLAVLLTVSLFFVWSRLQVTNQEYEISSFGARLHQLQQENKQLRLEAASLRNPARIEQLAATRLGLHYPTPAQIVTVE